ncbi:MAG: hypothetical protein KDD50_01015 [Bdellovibrionales bacterium]|nr:hypothetical protein [Bdellovibrionales bacterium]
MKKIVLASLLALSFISATSHAAGNEEKKCTGRLHSCFQGNFDLLVDLNPTSISDCESACTGDLAVAGDKNSCSLEECVSRCEVAFGIGNSCI